MKFNENNLDLQWQKAWDGDWTKIYDDEKVRWFWQFLEAKNEEGGFFSRGDSTRILERHVLDSALFVKAVTDYVSVSRETTVLDAGAGPGLPGFLFCCLKFPPVVTLNDSSRRRLSFLEAALHGPATGDNEDGVAASRAGRGPSPRSLEPRETTKTSEQQSRDEDIQPITTTLFRGQAPRFQYARLEEVVGRFKLITSRALIPFPSVLRLVAHLQKPGDYYAAYLGQVDPATHSKVIQECGYEFEASQVIQVPGSDGFRGLYLFRKIRTVRQGKPFAWKFIRNEMSEWQKS